MYIFTTSENKRVLVPKYYCIYTWVIVLSILSRAYVYGQGFPTSKPQKIGLSEASLAHITTAMQAYVDSGKVSGAVLMVARHGKIGYAQAIGSMNLEKNIPMRTDAVFRIASMTKPIIAVAIMKLVDKGKIRLDDPVTKFIPAFANLRVSNSNPNSQATPQLPKRPITVKDLLTHTSGLMHSNANGYTSVIANVRDPKRTLAEAPDIITKLPLSTSPEEKWAYSNFGFEVLGRIIEVASSRTLDQYLNEEIFVPLAMKETSFHVMPEMNNRIPVVYSQKKDGTLSPDAEFLEPNYLPSSRYLSSSGGLLSTPTDYLRFAQMLLNKGKFNGKRILTRASVARIMHNQLTPSLTPIVTPVFNHTGYGFGLGGAVLVDSKLSNELGSVGIYRWAGSRCTFFWIDPKKNLIATIWIQSRTIGYQMERHFQQLLYAAVLP